MKKNKAIIYTAALAAVIIISAAAVTVIRSYHPFIADVKQNSVSNTLKAVFLNVGEADAIILTTQKSTIVIDTGLKETYGTVADYLLDNKIKNIDYLIITHFDKDHIGGAGKLINDFNVANVLEPGYIKPDAKIDDYITALSLNKIRPQIIDHTFTVTLDQVEYTVFPPRLAYYESGASNNSSLIVRAVHGKESFLFTGDAEEPRLSEYMGSDTFSISCSVLKMPYHGRYLANIKAFLAAVKPEFAIITSKDPASIDRRTLDALAACSVTAYMTYNGNIEAISDGNSIKITQLLPGQT
jgi:competence protein ComEC